MTRFPDQTKSLVDQIAEYDKDPSLDPEEFLINALREGIRDSNPPKDGVVIVDGSKKKPKSQFSPPKA